MSIPFGVFTKDNQYVLVKTFTRGIDFEASKVGFGTLRITEHGTEMSDEWLLKNINKTTLDVDSYQEIIQHINSRSCIKLINITDINTNTNTFYKVNDVQSRECRIAAQQEYIFPKATMSNEGKIISWHHKILNWLTSFFQR